MPELEYYQKKNKKPLKRSHGISAKSLLGLLAIVIVLFCVLLSPVFAIKTITITDLAAYTKNEICTKIGVFEGANLFSFQSSKAKRTLMADPYIENVEIHRRWPDTLEIEIQERKICGYVPFLGAYLYIDSEGRVLDSQTSFLQAHPIVKGLSFDSFVVGEILPADNANALAAVVQVSRAIQQYEMDKLVLEMDVSDPNNLLVTINNITASLGKNTDIDEKIRILYQVAGSIPEGDRGKVDLSDLTKPIVFEYLM